MLKRKRKNSDAEKESDDRPVKRNRDVTIVAEHCESYLSFHSSTFPHDYP